MFTNIRKLELREGTTRYVEVVCLDQNGESFDFEGYTATTWLAFSGMLGARYVPTAISGNVLSYKIPADMSVGKNVGAAETRIFKAPSAGSSAYDVFEALRVDINVVPARKPDVAPTDNASPAEGVQ